MEAGGTRSNITVTLKSGDGEVFKVSEAVARQSQTIRFLMEPDDYIYDHQDVFDVPLPNVGARILAKVIKYCKWKVGTPAHASEGEKRKWEKQFVDVDQKTIFELIHAANYMEIEELLDLACAAVADMIRGKSPEEIRRIFGIKNDFTTEEVEDIRRENEWALD